MYDYQSLNSKEIFILKSLSQFIKGKYYLNDDLTENQSLSLAQAFSNLSTCKPLTTPLHDIITTSALALYVLYNLSHMECPSEELGFFGGGDIYISFVGTSNAFKYFKTLVSTTSYFNKKFQALRVTDSKMYFPNKVIVEYVSGVEKLRGKDLLIAVVDDNLVNDLQSVNSITERMHSGLATKPMNNFVANYCGIINYK